MFLSRLILNPHPSARHVIRDLGDAYQMHRTLVRAFVSGEHDSPSRFLYRLELPRESGRPPVMLVQSVELPDWSALAALPGYLVDHQCKAFEPEFAPGRRLRFRLRANPTVKRNGKRLSLKKEEDQRQWLDRKGEQGGFRIDEAIAFSRGRIVGNKPSSGRIVHDYAEFDGILCVTNSDDFRSSLRCGIGPAKAFGCGLLSLARG